MMKRKVKLAFEQLERELSIVPQLELAQVLGGFSSGSSGTLSSDASLDEIVDYFEDMGFEFEEDSSGNYYFNAANSSGTIMLDEVNVYAYANGSGHSSGDDDWWQNQSGIMAEYGDFLGSYIGYFSSFGHSFSSVNGTPSYNSGGSTGGGNNNQNDDPWQRDSNGKILTTDVEGATFTQTFDGREVTFQEVTIDGTDVIAYRIVSVEGYSFGQIPDRFFSNCHGFAFADGDLWFNDPWDPNFREPSYNEMGGFESMLNSNTAYSEVSNIANADVAVIWWTYSTGETVAIHSGKVTSDGKFDFKTSSGEVQYGKTIDEFKAGQTGTSDNTYTIKYYKQNF